MKQKRNTVAVLSQSIDARPGGQACGSLIRFDDFDPHAAGGARPQRRDAGQPQKTNRTTVAASSHLRAMVPPGADRASNLETAATAASSKTSLWRSARGLIGRFAARAVWRFGPSTRYRQLLKPTYSCQTNRAIRTEVGR
jgi:hypothetical protein